ncbi:shikimate kinase [Aminipila sp.]|uniref:shikimate kinase n=1 Tax=Aminipila sp. TaxID=2060095 RepID=UPI0028A029DD|nr:shikimate kinase [Aminipila sp.]
MSNFNKHIYLIGFMGTGKSQVSKELGDVMELKVLDTDTFIEDISGISIPEIFEQKGEDYFRTIETKVLQKIATSDSSIVSCGGGIAVKDENVEIMKKSGKVILLTASAENIYIRVKSDTQRPLLKNNMNVKYIEGLMKKRQAAYEKAADIIVNTDDKDILQICQEIVLKLRIMEGTE